MSKLLSVLNAMSDFEAQQRATKYYAELDRLNAVLEQARQHFAQKTASEQEVRDAFTARNRFAAKGMWGVK